MAGSLKRWKFIAQEAVPCVQCVHRINHMVELPLFLRALLIDGIVRRGERGAMIRSWLDSFRGYSAHDVRVWL